MFKQIIKKVDEYTTFHPYQTMSIALSVGVLLGFTVKNSLLLLLLI